MRSTLCLAAPVLAFALAPAALAVDVGFGISGSGLYTAPIDDAVGVLGSLARVFDGEVGPGHQTDKPGLNAPEGTFTPGTTFGFNVLGSLRAWNGSAFVETPVGVVLTRPAESPLFVPASGNATTPGYSLTVDATGGFDYHVFFNLIAGGGGVVPDGVYLLSFDYHAADPTTGPYTPTPPVFVILNDGDTPENAAAAFAYAESALVPAPASGLVLLGGLALRRRR